MPLYETAGAQHAPHQRQQEGSNRDAGSSGDGDQQTIAILGLTNIIQQSDPQLRKFRQLFLPLYNANDTNVISVSSSGCNDPYSGSAAEQLKGCCVAVLRREAARPSNSKVASVWRLLSA